MKEISEIKSCWLKSCAGDKDSFQHIYNHFFQPLFFFGLRFTPDKDIVKDVLQGIFLELWQNKERLSHIESPKTYLYAIVRNAFIKFHQKKKALINVDGLADEYVFEIVKPIEHKWIEQECKQALIADLHKAFEAITVKQKEFLYLKYVKGFTFEEVSQVMKISTKAGYKLHKRAIDAMKEHLEDYGDYFGYLIVFYFNL